jgi:hypothetical protein
MPRNLKQIAIATVAAPLVALALQAPASAAVLSFDLSGLEDTFGLRSPVTGGFTVDTVSGDFSLVDFATDLASYTLPGSILDGAGFGLSDQFFLFTSGVYSFFFGIDGFDLGDPQLAIGESIKFPDVFAFESDDVNDDFQIGIDGYFTLYAGTVDVAAIPLPATLPLIGLGLAGLGLVAGMRGSRVTAA